MASKNLFYRPVSWVIFVLAAAASVIYIYHNFEKANPLVNVAIQMDRQTALDEAAQLAAEFKIGPDTFRQAAAFRNDYRFQNFTELEAGGLDTFNTIISEGYYSSYYWAVRHFKEQEANEAVFWFKPSGEIYGFHEKIPESEPGAALTQEEALRAAEHHAIYNWDVDLTYYELIEESKTEQLSGRVDHTFVYERTDKAVGEGKFRIKLVVSGDKLTTIEHFVKIPESFDRRYSEMRSANDTLQTISSAAIVLLYGLLGVVLGIFVLIRKRRLIWKPAVYWGMGIALASVFLLSVNSLPFAWFSYDTSTSHSNYLLQQLLGGLMGAIGFGAIMAVSFMAAEGLDRMAFPGHIQWWKIWSKNTGGSLPVLGQTVAGYLFAVIILFIDILFYVTTTTHFGWWSPAGTLSDPNVLATHLPWLESIAISLQAGFWEEALFRAVPIAGVFILTKGKKSRTFWVVMILFVQTLIFGAAHANYAQQPAYARVIEMIVPFTIMGVIYIYYGILPAVIAHYAVDVFWISLPLWVTSETGIWLDRTLVLLFLFLPLLIVFFFRFRNKKWTKVPEAERNSGWETPELNESEQKEPEVFAEIKKLNIEKWMLPLGIAGLMLWIYFTPFKTDSPVLELSKKEVIESAKNELQERYEVDLSDWTILSYVDDNVDIRDIFAWQTGGDTTYRQLLGNYLAPPHWVIRLVKITGDAEEKTEEYRVRIANDGTILSASHKIPEKQQGENLTQIEAQKIADKALNQHFSIDRTELKEISVSPEKLENRTDWEFTYADTANFLLDRGQGRYTVEVSGKEVTNVYSYVHIPEEWERSYNDARSKKTVIRTVGNILVAGIIFMGLILAIIRWTRKKFHLKIFIRFTLLFALLFALDNWINRDSLIAGYNTQVPLQNYITTLLISITISGVFFSLFSGIIIGATPGWLPVNSKAETRNLLYVVGFGLLAAGVWAAIGEMVPQTSPRWLDYSFLNGSIPWLGLAVSGTTNIIFYPAFIIVLFLGTHIFTKAWTANQWIGVVFFSVAGWALMALNFENYLNWFISGLAVALFFWAAYYYFIRFHFEWIPVGIGLLPMMKMAKEMVISSNVNYIIGGTLMIIISFAILFGWTRLLFRHSFRKRQMSPDNEI